jgi:two-component sensor histidine kinase
MVDATERRRREEQNGVLIGELRHRLKNLLSLVQALARQTEVANRSGEEYRDAFLGRFDALVRAQELSMSERAIALADLVGKTLEPYRSHEEAVEVEAGPAVSLKPAQVTSLSLILHELATNAVKHGALSIPEGRLRVSWNMIEEAVDGRHLQLCWRERGGPQMSSPSSHGLGTRLIKFAAVHDLGGEVQQTFAPEGLTTEVTFPL